MSDDLVYLDFAATTPMDPGVIDAMREAVDSGVALGNPSSIHTAGRRATAAVEKAREQLAALLNADPARLIFTSGATESDNLAIRGAALARASRGRHLVTMRTEHKAVVDTFLALEKEGFEVTWLTPAEDGRLSTSVLEGALRGDTQLVSIMLVNNETGVMQDIRAIGALCRDRDVIFHTDAAQAVGKVDVDLETLPVDLLSLTAHKFYGPKGIGALYMADRPGCGILPILFGGGQEKRLRPGTLPTHLAIGLGAAAAIAERRWRDDLEHVTAMRDRLWAGVSQVDGLHRNSHADAAYPGILNVDAAGVEGESLMLAIEPVCVASGSACNSKRGEPSYVLRALGRTDLEAQSAVRFSFGRTTTDDDVDTAVERYIGAVTRLRSMSPGS